MMRVADLLGYLSADPGFWLPLAGVALLAAVLVGAVVLDGFALGVACLTVCAPSRLRAPMRSVLNRWRDVHLVCLLWGFGLFLTAFPYAVHPMFAALALPLGLLALGTLLRGVALAYRLRAPRAHHVKLDWGIALGAWLVAVAQGLALSAFVLQFDDFPGSLWFTVFGVLGVVATYSLLGATWLIRYADAPLRARAVHWALYALRAAVAGAVGVCTVLGVLNPSVLARWWVGLPTFALVTLWTTLLLGVVAIEMVLRRPPRATVIPFGLALSILLLVLGGLFYSVFPDLVPGNITLWDGAASVATLRVVLPAWALAIVVVLGLSAWNHRGGWGARQGARQ